MNDLPKKQLEDLFKKTVTKPSVYYLPLNDSEVSFWIIYKILNILYYQAEKRWAKKKHFNESNTTKNTSLGDRRRYSLNKRGFSPDYKRDRRDSLIFRRY